MKKQNKHAFQIANREALIGVGLVLFHFTWWFAFAYGFGKEDPSNYQYIFGFPAWFFYSCIVGIILISVLVIIIVKFFFTDLPLDDEEYEKR
ncbi:YhdT family protein [Gracilibacillus sp. S3-1-1]|uniref:YhdT family protein n=1 Tax=Gracilibacillus pellucidus TaxID=3095368 RepID=A0ACC6M429_9BACI|nr:YhdT family protein [Gracilibacillus sp. S3-1-1]MDX8045646.1 YhdT family protein [Gracilibacillus sp. S3-1-1]